MALSEFELIRRYFAQGAGVCRPEVTVGVGDDAAVVALPPGRGGITAQATLTGAEAARFARDPRSLGHRALAKALDKLAASGATPAFATLSLSLEDADAAWLEAFSAGLGALAVRHRVQLIGGDTTRGPLRISIAVTGLVEIDAAAP